MTIPDLFTTATAAAYLRTSIANIKKRVYVIRDLTPDAQMGHALFFTRATLDAFAATWQRRNRPTPD
jgi:hypothetical protein